MHRGGVGLREDGPEQRGRHVLVAAGHHGEQVPDEMHPAALAPGAQQDPIGCRGEAQVGVGGGKNIRILFAFDPNRAAVLLLGGDKAGQWDSWYKTAIPRAEQLYRHHLQQSGPDTGQANQ